MVDNNGIIINLLVCITLFNGVSTFTGHLIPKTSLSKKSHHHHHQVVLLAWISLSRHSSLSSIASKRSSRLHPVSVQSCCRYVLAGQPKLAHPCVGVHRRTFLMNSSLLLQQCSACLVHLIWMDLEMVSRWLYS